MSAVVLELEQRLLPPFAEAARRIEQDFPSVRARPRSSSIGARTDYQAHVVGVECWFPDAPADRSDNVALGIIVRHLTTVPELCEASVVWGHPSGACEIDMIESALSYSETTLAEVEDQLAELIAALRRAVGRGEPPL